MGHTPDKRLARGQVRCGGEAGDIGDGETDTVQVVLDRNAGNGTREWGCVEFAIAMAEGVSPARGVYLYSNHIRQ